MSSSTQTSSRILISRLSAHGDVIQTLPLLAAIKERFPDAYIGWLIEESAAPLLMNHPLIDRLHVSRRKGWLQELRQAPWQLRRVGREVSLLIAELRNEHYDISLDVQGLLKSALPPFLAKIPRRLGYANTREHAAFFYTETLPYHDLKNPNYPTVLKFMEFVQAVDRPASQAQAFSTQSLSEIRFPLPPEDLESLKRVETWLHTLPSNAPLVALAPGTIWSSKRWPEEHWETLLFALAQEPLNGVLIGTLEDYPVFEGLLANLPDSSRFLNLAGKTKLTDLYALFSYCDWMIGPDSAPLHIANAVSDNHPMKKPRILGLYGPTASGRTGPIGTGHTTLQTTLDCQPCFQRCCPLQTNDCMKHLSPEDVLRAFRHFRKAEAPLS